MKSNEKVARLSAWTRRYGNEAEDRKKKEKILQCENTVLVLILIRVSLGLGLGLVLKC